MLLFDVSDYEEFSDEELREHFIRTGDKRYFRALYRRLEPLLFGKIRSFTTDAQMQEDLFQDVMIKVYFALPRFTGQSKVRTWAYRITVNHCIDYYHRKKKQAQIPIDLLAETLPDESAEVTSQVDQRYQAQMVQEAMELLPADDRALLLSRYFQHESIKSLCDLYDISESACKMRLMRARDNFKLVYSDMIQLVQWLVLTFLWS